MVFTCLGLVCNFGARRFVCAYFGAGVPQNVPPWQQNRAFVEGGVPMDRNAAILPGYALEDFLCAPANTA